MLDSKAAWVEPCRGQDDRTLESYPEESLAEWKRRLGLEC
jgi:hypothetical protein